MPGKIANQPGSSKRLDSAKRPWQFQNKQGTRDWRAARSPASAIIAGTTSELSIVDVVTGATVSTTAGTLRRSALTHHSRLK
jgi:hypothetical protein